MPHGHVRRLIPCCPSWCRFVLARRHEGAAKLARAQASAMAEWVARLSQESAPPFDSAFSFPLGFPLPKPQKGGVFPPPKKKSNATTPNWGGIEENHLVGNAHSV